MSTNVVYLIGDKNTGKIFNANGEFFDSNIGFESFYPARYLAENVLNNELGDIDGQFYSIVEAEVIKFDIETKELTLKYEPFVENPFL